jgi:electron transfer flavoprotein-quinone oxidoreductase
MKEKFTVAIVGAGPAGISAACTLADARIKTIVLERGEYPGTKNMSGCVTYGHNLAEIVPNFWEKHCPIERNIVESRIYYVSDDAGYSISYRDKIFSEDRKYNAFTIARSKFDKWFAQTAASKGALITPGTVVLDFIKNKKGKVIGLKTNREDGDVFADCVILADGINSPLAAKTGYRKEALPVNVALAVKEVIELDSSLIENRFGVNQDNGVTIEILGKMAGGMNGVGALYTNKNSLSLILGANLEHFAAYGIKPYEMMDKFKKHPMIENLISGGKTVEYTAHWLAEGGYKEMPKLHGNGFLIAGDSAMLFNALHREGSNLAMASGKKAAETIMECIDNDFSEKFLSRYTEKMRSSFIMKDMKKYKHFPSFLHHTKEIFNNIPDTAEFAAREILTVNGISKKLKQKIILADIRKRVGLIKLLKILVTAFRAVK